MWLLGRGLFRPFGPLGLALLAYRFWRRLSPARKAGKVPPIAAMQDAVATSVSTMATVLSVRCTSAGRSRQR